ncbi:hypothetical protein M427DRAFT_56330 [Gonapodya prolifera JEL478]|uniref:Uncharacterized protein n=1 Tax=Gonapodya prolifera (strain JEL478) TaxID=1344416 RepID=A0A139AI09_GONPJ|nr:hypothetical protein M427DRAFT_56330 [Gonapodya prolifera JEL478]|eukprot:KXS16043.1 hypothetical protein M427DRAFT_56330 [Gonapodya prolifera JEL478]
MQLETTKPYAFTTSPEWQIPFLPSPIPTQHKSDAGSSPHCKCAVPVLEKPT